MTWFESEVGWKQLNVEDQFRWAPTEGRFEVLEIYPAAGMMRVRDLTRYDAQTTWYCPHKNRTVWRIEDVEVARTVGPVRRSGEAGPEGAAEDAGPEASAPPADPPGA